MQLAFAAVRTAGELIGLQMGLSFATFVDPGSHLNMPVLARIIDLLAMLLFLSFQRPSLAYLHAGGYVPYAADWRKSGEQQRFPRAYPALRG